MYNHRGHHLFDEYGICEIVDAGGNPAEPGVRGRLVGTGLHNMTMPLMVLRPFMYVKGIMVSQFIQHSLTDYTVRIATERELSDEEVDELISNLCVRLGGTVNIKVEQMDDIPRSVDRKFRRVVSEVPLKLDRTASTSSLLSAEAESSPGNGEGGRSAGGEGA